MQERMNTAMLIYVVLVCLLHKMMQKIVMICHADGIHMQKAYWQNLQVPAKKKLLKQDINFSAIIHQ